MSSTFKAPPAAIARLTFASPIGGLAIVAEADAVVGVRFDATEAETVPGEGSSAALTLCERARAELAAYLAGDLQTFTVPFEARGSAFQRAVWAAMLAIPYGRTRAYGELAAAIGEPGAARAVGLACGANPLPLVVPCHRVLAAGGRLGGFGGGRDRKRWLLDLETYGRPPGRLFAGAA